MPGAQHMSCWGSQLDHQLTLLPSVSSGPLVWELLLQGTAATCSCWPHKHTRLVLSQPADTVLWALLLLLLLLTGLHATLPSNTNARLPAMLLLLVVVAAPVRPASSSCRQQTCKPWWLLRTGCKASQGGQLALKEALTDQTQLQAAAVLQLVVVVAGKQAQKHGRRQGPAARPLQQAWGAPRRQPTAAWQRGLLSCCAAGTHRLPTAQASCLLGWRLGLVWSMWQMGCGQQLLRTRRQGSRLLRAQLPQLLKTTQAAAAATTLQAVTGRGQRLLTPSSSPAAWMRQQHWMLLLLMLQHSCSTCSRLCRTCRLPLLPPKQLQQLRGLLRPQPLQQQQQMKRRLQIWQQQERLVGPWV